MEALGNNIPFTMERKSIVLVKPSTSTPSEVLSLSTLDNDPNMERIGHIIFSYQANESYILANGNSNDPASIIEEALSKLLVYYYLLAGKLKRGSDGKLLINCNADGVPFSVATAHCKLSSLNYLDGIDFAIARQFVLDLPSDFDSGCHPLMFQVTKFSCGGFTVAMGMAHSVFDGFGAAQIYRALTEIASKRSEAPSVRPVWQRERLVAKWPAQEIAPHETLVLDKNALATSPYMPTMDIVHEYVNITAGSIKRLKMMSLIKESDQDQNVSSYEVLGAYIWRSKCRALKLDPNGKTVLRLVVGIRQFLPNGYYGNAFINVNVIMTCRDLDEGSFSEVVKRIKESKRLASTEDYMRKAMSIMEKRRQLNSQPDGATGASMVFSDWRQTDFGWTSFVNMISLPWKMYGDVDLCILKPPSNLDHSMKGGVKALVSLPRASMAKFKVEMNLLNHGSLGGYSFEVLRPGGRPNPKWKLLNTPPSLAEMVNTPPSPLPEMTFQRAVFGTFVDEDVKKMVIFGGAYGPILFIYDVEADQWEEHRPLSYQDLDKVKDIVPSLLPPSLTIPFTRDNYCARDPLCMSFDSPIRRLVDYPFTWWLGWVKGFVTLY
ncbi:Transferase [Corchorus olitorius]|uniref:Transferase n=1 Tax=Corchorus olitorius TaxID=93759 RepID=A0A1R3K5I1_9ROSI|nr:Transferase [Corchorus olitorius]